MAKSIFPHRGFFLCLALAVGILGCQPPTSVTEGGDTDTATTKPRTPKPSVTAATTEPGVSPDPGETPSANPSNALGILGVDFAYNYAALQTFLGDDVPSTEGEALIYPYSLFLAPPSSDSYPLRMVKDNVTRALYPTVLKQAFLARVDMANNNSPADEAEKVIGLTLKLPGKSFVELSAPASYRLGDAPFATLTNCEELRGVVITTAIAQETTPLGTVQDNGIRILIDASAATASLEPGVTHPLEFEARSLLAEQENVAIRTVKRKVFLTNCGVLYVEPQL